MSKKCAKCSIACNLSCSNCKKVWYCSVDHQISHRKEHKKECFPATVKEMEEHDGWCLVATRDLKKGETLWIDKPLMVGPVTYDTPTSADTMCLGCCKILPGSFGDELPSQTQICSVCQWPLCHPNCRDKKWHYDFECKILKENNLVPSDFKRTTPHSLIYDSIRVLRMILLQKINSDYWDIIIQCRNNQINGHNTQTHELDRVLSYVDDFIREKCKIDMIPEQIEYIIKITMQHSQKLEMTKSNNQFMDYNVIRRCCKIMSHRGTFVHSCIPNVSVGTSKDWLDDEVYATVDIKSGEILTVCSYQMNYETFAFRGHVERQRLIPITKSSFCKCELCIDPTDLGTFLSAIKCTNEVDDEPCPGYFLPCIITTHVASLDALENGKWRCNFSECNAEEKYSTLEKKIINLATEILDTKSSLDKKLNLILEHENKTVHENHFLMMKLLFDSLVILERKMDRMHYSPKRDLVECLNVANQIRTFAERCMKVADIIYPGVSGCRALLLCYIVSSSDRAYEYHSLLNEQKTTEVATEVMEAASETEVARPSEYYLDWKLKRENVYREALRITSRARDYDASLSNTLYYKLRMKRVEGIPTFDKTVE